MEATEYDKLVIGSKYTDGSLYASSLGLPPVISPFSINIRQTFSAADNFGQGVHTETVTGHGNEFTGFSFPRANFREHTISLQVTYQIDVTDIRCTDRI